MGDGMLFLNVVKSRGGGGGGYMVLWTVERRRCSNVSYIAAGPMATACKPCLPSPWPL